MPSAPPTDSSTDSGAIAFSSATRFAHLITPGFLRKAFSHFNPRETYVEVLDDQYTIKLGPGVTNYEYRVLHAVSFINAAIVPEPIDFFTIQPPNNIRPKLRLGPRYKEPAWNVIILGTIHGKALGEVLLQLTESEVAGVLTEVRQVMDGMNRAIGTAGGITFKNRSGVDRIVFPPVSTLSDLDSDRCFKFPLINGHLDAPVDVADFRDRMRDAARQTPDSVMAERLETVLAHLQPRSASGTDSDNGYAAAAASLLVRGTDSMDTIRFCHMDLHSGNIMVRYEADADGVTGSANQKRTVHLSGIIDWEFAGWYTWRLEVYVAISLHWRDMRCPPNVYVAAWDVASDLVELAQQRVALVKGHVEFVTGQLKAKAAQARAAEVKDPSRMFERRKKALAGPRPTRIRLPYGSPEETIWLLGGDRYIPGAATKPPSATAGPSLPPISWTIGSMSESPTPFAGLITTDVIRDVMKRTVLSRGSSVYVVNDQYTLKLGWNVTSYEYRVLQMLHPIRPDIIPKPLDFFRITFPPGTVGPSNRVLHETRLIWSIIVMSTVRGTTLDMVWHQMGEENAAGIMLEVQTSMDDINRAIGKGEVSFMNHSGETALVSPPTTSLATIGNLDGTSCLKYPLVTASDHPIPIADFRDRMRSAALQIPGSANAALLEAVLNLLQPRSSKSLAEAQHNLRSSGASSMDMIRFGHIGLHARNILVRYTPSKSGNGPSAKRRPRLVGIIDWKNAGWYTWALEVYNAISGYWIVDPSPGEIKMYISAWAVSPDMVAAARAREIRGGLTDGCSEYRRVGLKARKPVKEFSSAEQGKLRADQEHGGGERQEGTLGGEEGPCEPQAP